jgi:hypothetical protein
MNIKALEQCNLFFQVSGDIGGCPSYFDNIHIVTRQVQNIFKGGKSVAVVHKVGYSVFSWLCGPVR